jgi:hypothetical protein
VKWVKKGLVFSPEGQHDWVKSHAMLPIADHVEGDVYRVYFSGRDASNRSLIGSVDVDLTNPTRPTRLSPNPILGLGELGAFDDNGVSPTWMMNVGARKYLYFMGWNKGSLVRAAEVSGLAISDDGGASFIRHSRAPVIDRTDAEPFQILVISCILVENGVWRMWYDSADRWLNPSLPRYNIKYGESTDGLQWTRKGVVSVSYKSDDETRVSRASVIKDGDVYRMWFCYAMGTGGYTMGYAESSDGAKFERMDDKAGIAMSSSGWDSEMICYPHVFVHKGQKFMLYCGNGYGRTGFGLAAEE